MKERPEDGDPAAWPTVGRKRAGSNLVASSPAEGVDSTPLIRPRREVNEPDWERLAAEVRFLASDLDDLGMALRDLSTSQSDPTASGGPDASPPKVELEGWPPDASGANAPLAGVDQRLAQVKRSLGIVGAVVRKARRARPSVDSPSPSLGLGLASDSDPAVARGDLIFPAGPLSEGAEESAPARSKGSARRKRRARRSPRRASPRSRERPSAASATEETAGQAMITAFLKTNRTEKFDIQMLNALPLSTLFEEARGDRSLFAAAADRAEDLMARVKHETDDPVSAGSFLRGQVRRWYIESVQAPDWATVTPPRWAGLFADSRVHGGHLRPWLNHRLWTFREHAIRAGPIGKKLKRKLAGDVEAETAVMRDGPEQIRAEVAQALLDDLSAHPREPGVPLPLVALSELAVRRQVVTVNEALGQLFSVPDSGPFVLLHPNRYPDCEEMVIRPPVPRARGAALAYTLGPGRPSPKTVVRERREEGPIVERASRPPPPPVAAMRSAPAPVSADAPLEEAWDAGLDSETIWQADSVTGPTWSHLIDETRESRGRLSAPPTDFRARPAYAGFIGLLLDDPEFRKGFLAVRWRARPAGPTLLASLLSTGSLEPEVSTDHEYLEAELGELTQLNLATKTSEDHWTARGWAITREGSHRDGFRFRAAPVA